MRILDLFWKKRTNRQTKKRRKKRSSVSADKKHFERIEADIQNLQAQIGTANILLRKHDEDIVEHSILIEKHTKRIGQLEQIVAEQAISSPGQQIGPVNRPDSTANLPQAPPTHAQPQKLNVARFSEQEKRILSVFFHNRDMALSYVDIARALNKSHHTVKNQMNQMWLKADLFNCAVGNESRKRFKLKDGLKIEKYLNVG